MMMYLLPMEPYTLNEYDYTNKDNTYNQPTTETVTKNTNNLKTET